MTAAEPDLGSPTAMPDRTSQRERVKASQDMAAALAHELRGPVSALPLPRSCFAIASPMTL